MSLSKGPRPSTSYLARRCDITEVDPAIIWQTRQQRDKYDLVGLVRARDERSGRTYRQSESGQGRDGRGHREESPDRRRGRSFSRVRSYSRGRSRSPRQPGQPGPGILKRSCSTHERRKREGSVGWKMLRISRVDQVREISPRREDGGNDDKDRGQWGEEEEGEQQDDQPWKEKDVEYRKTAKVVCTHDKCSSQKGSSEDHHRMCNATLMDSVYSNAEGNELDLNDDQEDLLDEDQYCHGFDPLVDRNPLLPVAAAYEDLIDKIESSSLEFVAGYMKVHFSGSYQSRLVQCRYMDCPTISLPSTLGLLPFTPRSGLEWLCTDHSHCLLCADSVTSTNSVMCVSCARLYHTSHLDYEMQDQLEMELYICKLCSDPDLLTQHNLDMDRQEDELNNNSSNHERQKKSANKSSTKSQKLNLTTKMIPRVSTASGGTKSSTSNGKQLLPDDLTLPPGWYRQLVRNSVNRWRVVIIGPDGRRFWSRNDVKRAFPTEGKKGIKWSEFDFSLSGSKGQMKT